MKQPISDKDVFRVLERIKNSEGNYPQDLIESRRGAFTKQAAALALLINSGVTGANSSGTSQSASTVSSTASGGTTSGITGTSSMGKILETALVVALVAEAGVAAYAYREKIADFFNSIFRPKVEQMINPTTNSTNLNTNNGSDSDSPTVTPTVIVTETPLPPGYTHPVQADNTTSGNPQAASTAEPDGDNGKHLGQTKQPTQEIKKNENK